MNFLQVELRYHKFPIFSIFLGIILLGLPNVRIHKENQQYSISRKSFPHNKHRFPSSTYTNSKLMNNQLTPDSPCLMNLLFLEWKTPRFLRKITPDSRGRKNPPRNCRASFGFSLIIFFMIAWGGRWLGIWGTGMRRLLRLDVPAYSRIDNLSNSIFAPIHFWNFDSAKVPGKF